MKPLNHDCHPTIEMFHVFSRRGDDDLANGPVGSDLLATLQHMFMSSLKDPRDANASGNSYIGEEDVFREQMNR